MSLQRLRRAGAMSSPAVNTIDLNVTMTMGASLIAPLYVFFDTSDAALPTTSTQTSEPWHDILYYWDFGDTSPGTWSTGIAGDSKNVDWGPIAGHVYETPGTFTPTLYAWDGVSVQNWSGTPIVVASAVAPTAWAGRKTVLASVSGNFTCAGVTTTGTVTLPIASPGVVGWTSHGRAVGDPVYFSNSGGALPTGLITGTVYYIIAAGFGANSFEVSTTFGGSAVNFTGSQSGTHTAIGGAILHTASENNSWDVFSQLINAAADASPAGPARGMVRENDTLFTRRTGIGISYVRSIGGPGMICPYNDSGPAPTANATVQPYASSSTVTITNASPGVVTWTAHGLTAGEQVVLTTTGSLPTGLNTTSIYYVQSGANFSANTFALNTSAGSGGINTSSAGSGTHTATFAAPQTGMIGLGALSSTVAWENMDDWRLVGMSLDPSSIPPLVASYGFTLIAGMTNLCILRCPINAASWLGFDFNYARVNDTGSSTAHSTWGYRMQDNIAIVDSPLTNPRVTATELVANTWGYLNGKRLFIAGNDMLGNGDLEASSHNFRCFHGEKVVLKHNTATLPGTGRHAFKIHGAEIISRTANTAYTSTFNTGRGDFRRPFEPVHTLGLWAADTKPLVWRCTTSGTTSALAQPSTTATVTITNASPAVVTWTAHNFSVNQPVTFTTTGALPTGLTAGTKYYVIAAGLATDTFRVSATRGGSAVNTSSAGSGTHTGAYSWNITLGSTMTDGTVVWTECSTDFYAGTMVPTGSSEIRDDRFGDEKFYSSEIYVARNKIINATSVWPIGIGPLDDDDYSLVYRVIVEGNWVSSTGTGVRAVNIWCRDAHVRNNVFRMDNTISTGLQFVYAGQRNFPNSSGYSGRRVKVYNNSCVSGAAVSTTITACAVDTTAQDVVARNNLLYCFGTAAAKVLTGVDDSGATVGQMTKSNNTGDVGTPTTDPKFPQGASPSLAALANWLIADGTSYTKNAGANVPVWRDIFGTTRTGGSMDIGATEQ